MNFVKSGVVRLPPGFRFHPTDEELVVQYLRRKVLSLPLPASVIPEGDVCKSNPWDLPGDLEQERYFFSKKEVKYPNGNRSNRATGAGYWKATGVDKQIVTCRGKQVVGMKKTLVFYTGKPPHGSRTDWIMHEYRLVSAQPNNPTQTQSFNAQLENWVLCRIFLKKRSSKNVEEITKSHNGRLVFYNFMTKEKRMDLNRGPELSGSGSSAITDVSCNQSDDHEETSSFNSLSIFRREP